MFTYRERDDYLEITFHAPESANALSLEAAREWAVQQKKFAKFRKPVVVRSLHPTVFCSGGNLRDHAKLGKKAEGLRANLEIKRILDSFAKWPVIKLAIVEGRALGGGVEWLGRFDFRWATEKAELTFWQKRVGLSFGWGGGAAWAGLLGEARVRQLLLEARTLGADEALRLGLVDRVVQSDDLGDTIANWVRETSSPVDAALCSWNVRTEARLFAKLWWGEAHRAVLSKWKARSSKS